VVSALHAHVVFVTTYRRGVFDAAMLDACERTMRDVSADVSAVLVAFTGEQELLNGTVCHGVRLRTVIAPSRQRAWVSYGINRDNLDLSTGIPITLGNNPSCYISLSYQLVVDDSGKHLMVESSLILRWLVGQALGPPILTRSASPAPHHVWTNGWRGPGGAD
jgi:hypothetical protein